MENMKKEELEKLVGIDKVHIFYDIVDEITKLYVYFKNNTLEFIIQ